MQEIVGLVRLCQATSSLPRTGGLLDQDSYFVYLYERVLVADAEKAELDQARQKAR